MNIQMRIITDENVDQLMSMSYSNNIAKLLHKPDDLSKEETEKMIKDYVTNMNMNVNFSIKNLCLIFCLGINPATGEQGGPKGD
jgi:hypothetical protein